MWGLAVCVQVGAVVLGDRRSLAPLIAHLSEAEQAAISEAGRRRGLAVTVRDAHERAAAASGVQSGCAFM